MVAALIFVSVLPGQDAGDYNQKVISDVQKLQRVEEAMRSFMAAHGRRPCPADGQYPLGNQYFGAEAANPGSCVGGTPAAPMGPDAGTGNIVAGTIPTRSLALDDSYAFDAFGRRFTYVVDKRATQRSSCIALEGIASGRPQPPGVGGLQIENTRNGTLLDQVMYAYITHGPQGFGAYPEQGALTPAQRMNNGSTDQDEETNAEVGTDGSFTYSPANMTNTLVQKDRTPTFDDIVWYRSDLKNTCCIGAMCGQLGIRIDGPLANGGLNGVQSYDINQDGVGDIFVSAGDGSSSFVGSVLFGHKGYWPFVIDLSSYVMTGGNGFTVQMDWYPTINGMADLDGDGIPDLVLSDGGYEAMVIFGQGSGGTYWPLYRYGYPFSSNLDGSHAAEIVDNDLGYDYGGVRAVGKFTTDTAAGVLFQQGDGLGVPANEMFEFIRGGPRPWPSSQNTSGMANGTKAIRFSGTGGAWTPFTIADMNGDNIGDIVVGASIVYGGSGPGGNWGGPYSFSNLNTPNNPSGMTIGAPAQDGGGAGNPTFPTAVAVGNFNNGGKNTLVLGNRDWGCCTGRTFIINGPLNTTSWANGWEPATQLNGTTGSTFYGQDGATGAFFADLNNDGNLDLIMTHALCCYTNYVTIVFGANVFGSSYTLGSDSRSVIISGMWNDNWGPSIATADLNGDGITDLVIGDPQANKVYIIWGHNTWPSSIDLMTLPSNQGIVINGTGGGSFGSSISTGDVNGDGIADLMICAPGQTNNGISGSGSCYVVWGHRGAWKWTINDTDL